MQPFEMPIISIKFENNHTENACFLQRSCKEHIFKGVKSSFSSKELFLEQCFILLYPNFPTKIIAVQEKKYPERPLTVLNSYWYETNFVDLDLEFEEFYFVPNLAAYTKYFWVETDDHTITYLLESDKNWLLFVGEDNQ
jgi:hypothetical protein